jgi:hypothetical protein
MKKILLPAFFVLIFDGLGFSLTLNDIRFEVRRNVMDTPSTQDQRRYGDSVLNKLVNEAQKQVVSLTWCLEKSTVVTVVNGTAHYTMPSDFLAPIQVLFSNPSGTETDLEIMTREKVYGLDADWETSTGALVGYWVRNDSRVQAQQYLSLYDSPNSTGTLTVHYFSSGADLSAGTDIPFDGLLHLYQFHPMLVYFVSARLKQFEGKFDEAESYFRLYGVMEKNLIDRFGRVSAKEDANKISRPEKQ